jgi:hypothetical protein
MRRSIFSLAAVMLILACGVFSASDQGNPGYNPQGRRDNPQNPTRMGDRRSFVGPLSLELVRQAEYLSESSYDYFMGWNGTITNPEQAILFKSEEFAASCRLFNRLVQDQTGYFGRDSMRTNLHSAFRYVALSFRQLEEQMRLGGVRDDFARQRRDGRRFEQRSNRGTTGRFGLAECRRILDRIDSEITSWR